MKALVVANWKMNPTSARAAALLFSATKKAADKARRVSVVVAPPALYLRDLAAKKGKIALALQSGRAEEAGAFTGDVSLAQAKDARCAYALVGHAERRAAGETNEDTRAKVSAALKLGLAPILCVGEHKRSAGGEHFAFVREQLRVGLAEVPATALKKIIIAYEPVWAIGASAPMTPRDMHEMAIFIRKTIVELAGQQGMDVSILYGGAIDAASAVPMLEGGDVDGLLVGRASADAKQFTELLENIASA